MSSDLGVDHWYPPQPLSVCEANGELTNCESYRLERTSPVLSLLVSGYDPVSVKSDGQYTVSLNQPSDKVEKMRDRYAATKKDKRIDHLYMECAAGPRHCKVDHEFPVHGVHFIAAVESLKCHIV